MIKNILIIIIFLTFSYCCQLFAAEYDTTALFFEHWRHYDSQGIACEECHKGPNAGIYTLSGHKECETCHPRGKKNDYEEKAGQNCEKCHPIDTSYSTKLLSKVDRSNRSFYHTKQTHPLCDICHGPMLEDSVSIGQLLFSQDERDKIRRKSHRFHFVQDCKACHTDGRDRNKKPKNHETDWLKKGHIEVAPEFRCRICHTKSSCKDCHEESY